MLLRGCARCGGDVFLEEALGSVDVVCLQCGYRRITKLSRSDAKEYEQAKRLSRGKKAGVSARAAA